MELRTELTDAQKKVEPRNADSHLTFIGAGLRNCVTYRPRPDAPVYFIELDGEERGACGGSGRRPSLAYDDERVVARTSVRIPVSKHPIDSVNLADPRLGLLEQRQRAASRAPASSAAASIWSSSRPSATSASRSTSTRRC